MRHFQKELIKSARPETLPEIPRNLRWKAKFFGKQAMTDYLWNYYERESEKRVPFYLPYIYMTGCFDYLRRYGQIPKKRIQMVLIDDGDFRTDYFLKNYLEEFNYLTLVTERKEYFESLQERAFQELGLLIDLFYPWEKKILQGNLVWDFSRQLQKEDCYPEGSVCFLPHKDQWNVQEVKKYCHGIQVIYMGGMETPQGILDVTLAECLLVPADFPFRESRCKDLKIWCKEKQWRAKMKVETLEKP